MIRLLYGLVGLLALIYQRVVTPPGQIRAGWTRRPAVKNASKPAKSQQAQERVPPADWQRRMEEAGRPPADWIERVENSRELDWIDYEAGEPQRPSVSIQREVQPKVQPGPAGKTRFSEARTVTRESRRPEKKVGLKLNSASPSIASKASEIHLSEPIRRHARVIHEIKTISGKDLSDSSREIEQEPPAKDRNLKDGRDEKKPFTTEMTLPPSIFEPVRISQPTALDNRRDANNAVKSKPKIAEAVDRLPGSLPGQFPPVVESTDDRWPSLSNQRENDRMPARRERSGLAPNPKPPEAPKLFFDGQESGTALPSSKQLLEAPIQPPVATPFPAAQDQPSHPPAFNEMSRLWPDLPEEDWGDNRGLDTLRQEQEHLHRLDREQRGL